MLYHPVKPVRLIRVSGRRHMFKKRFGIYQCRLFVPIHIDKP
jgi:hypothetical protein